MRQILANRSTSTLPPPGDPLARRSGLAYFREKKSQEVAGHATATSPAIVSELRNNPRLAWARIGKREGGNEGTGGIGILVDIIRRDQELVGVEQQHGRVGCFLQARTRL